MKNLFVAGDYDDSNGRSSKIGEEIFKSLNLSDVDYRNGGHYNDLLKFLDRIARYGLVFWLAKIPEDKPSVSELLKKRCNSFILVSSVRNINKKYSDLELISKALNIKSNLFVEFSEENNRYCARIMDPLGNAFLAKNSDMNLVGKVLGKRAKELLNYTGMESNCVGNKIPANANEEFLNLIRGYAEKFTELIYANENKERFMGNASFRCTKGFPSFRDKDIIFVSKRNVDKKGIESDSFIAVEPELESFVGYYGANKPSVDTPIQLKLYKNYPNINFMLHSHCYVENALSTEKIIPCGSLEEVDEITSVITGKNSKFFAINLRGHGSIVASNNLGRMKDIPYFARPIPEYHSEYLEDLA